MFDIGWQELLLIGVVALIVIGPKDMPVAMRAAARMFAKARGLTREFQNTVSEVVREAELDELRQKVHQAGRVNIKDELTDLVDPTGRLRDNLGTEEFADLDDDLHRELRDKPASGGGPESVATPGPNAPGVVPPNGHATPSPETSSLSATPPRAAPAADHPTTLGVGVDRRE